jgi:hypothetical protein
MACLRPPLRMVPEGHWLCDDCVDRRVLEARDFLIRNSMFFEAVGGSRKRSADDSKDLIRGQHALDDSDEANGPTYRPAAPFLEAAREFSIKISKVLCRADDD